MFFWWLLLSVFLAAGYLLFAPDIVKILNLRSTDLVINMTNMAEAELAVTVVEIDEKSLERHGQWPWPRYKLAQLLKHIEDAGARTIGVNVLFAERDRTSPERVLNMLESEFGYSIAVSDIPQRFLDYDLYLAETLGRGPCVLGYTFLFDPMEHSSAECRPPPVPVLYGQDQQAIDPFVNPHEAEGILCSNERIRGSAVGAGFLNGNSDVDGVVRKLPLVIRYKGEIYPSFSLAVFMHYRDIDLIRMKNEGAGISRVLLDGASIPMDDRGHFYLGHIRSPEFHHISAGDILEDRADPLLFKGKIVLVGLAASGLTQMYKTSLGTTTLLDLHTLSLQSLASDFQTIRTPLFRLLETAAGISGCFLLAAAIALSTPLLSMGLCLLLTGLAWYTAAIIYQNSGYLFSPFFATAALVATFCILMTFRYRFLQKLAQNEKENALFLLRSSENELQSILGTIPDIVFRLDKNGKVTFVSQAVTRYVPSADSLIGRSIFEFIKAEDIGKADHKVNERRTGERATYDLELRLLFPAENGEGDEEDARYFSVSASGLYSSTGSGPANFLGTQGIVRDITDRKKLERELVQAQKMEVIGNLAAGIAHDLNNILAGLVSYPDLLLTEVPKDSPLHTKIVLLQKSGQKAADIVQDLLTLARRKVQATSMCSLNAIIREYLDSVEFSRLYAQHSRINLKIDLDENIAGIQGSAVHLSKVVMNLVHNGLESMPEAGGLTIKTSQIQLEEPVSGYERIPPGKYALLRISDSGVGIAPEDLKRIFEPFYTKRASNGRGTGLGMTVVWATVKDHQGYVDISSRLRRGTDINLYFPVSEAITVRKPSPPVRSKGSESVLIVDDMPDQLEIGRRMLEKLGYEVSTARGGEKALQHMAERCFDLVILDMIMPPGMSGLETYREIKKLHPRQKAIIASGYSASEKVEETLKLGAGRLVPKPYSLETIGQAVREELDRVRSEED